MLKVLNFSGTRKMLIFAALSPQPPTPPPVEPGEGERMVGTWMHSRASADAEEGGEGFEKFEEFKGIEEFEDVGNFERAN